MKNLVMVLQELVGKTVVVFVNVIKHDASSPFSYMGTLQVVGEDYIRLDDSGFERYIAMSAIVSFYERKEQPVSQIPAGPKLF